MPYSMMKIVFGVAIAPCSFELALGLVIGFGFDFGLDTRLALEVAPSVAIWARLRAIGAKPATSPPARDCCWRD